MHRLFLFVAIAALAAGAETAKAARLTARLSAAENAHDVLAVYSSQRTDPAMRRVLLVSVDTILRGRKYPVTREYDEEIGRDLLSGYPLLVVQAIETSGHLRLERLSGALKRCFFDADRIDAAYASGIRQAVIAAIESMDDGKLAPVFLEFMLDRQRSWFNGDLTATLRALVRHGDSSCLSYVKQLKDKVLRFAAELNAAPGDDYRRAKCGEIIEAINAIESRFIKG